MYWRGNAYDSYSNIQASLTFSSLGYRAIAEAGFICHVSALAESGQIGEEGFGDVVSLY